MIKNLLIAFSLYFISGCSDKASLESMEILSDYSYNKLQLIKIECEKTDIELLIESKCFYQYETIGEVLDKVKSDDNVHYFRESFRLYGLIGDDVVKRMSVKTDENIQEAKTSMIALKKIISN